MLAPRARVGLSLLVGSVVAACGGSSEPTGTGSTPATLNVVGGNGQSGLVGQTLSQPLVVKVASSSGSAVRGVQVTFAVTAGAASVSPATTTTDSSGQAKTQVTFGSSPGTVSVSATVSGTSLVTFFALTSGSSSVTAACSTTAPSTPGVGNVAYLSGTGTCLGGGATGAEYAIVAFNANPDTITGTSLPVTVTGRGTTPLSVASTVPAFNAAPSTPLSAGSPSDLQSRFDMQLRQTARRELAPMVPAAQTLMRQRPSLASIPANPTVGTLYTLNANGRQACSAAQNRVARVAAVSNSAIVVADTTNPAGGFTDAEYQSFATMFDTLINPLDVSNFGQPSDIDKNGKVIIFFTKEVNLLTPRGSPGVIGGFFFERDLFPLTDNQVFGGCAGSNLAEMFYVLVPDPNHVYGDARTKQKVLDLTPGTLAHEYQHLINAGRRMYVNLPFNDFEEVWLNEGLSHMAEELLYYRVSGNAPRQNLTAAKLGQSQATADIFNHYQGDNNGRFETFLLKPSKTSVYGNNDSLETRGATWNLLRYLADHRGASDGDTWSQLVNTSLTGQQNLAHVFGATYMTQIRDWATTVFSDDIPGVTDTRFLEPSWNLRDIFPRLVDGNGTPLGKYPLSVIPLSDGVASNQSIYSGGAAYFRFSVPANGQASVDWSNGQLPPSAFLQFTLVRTK